MNLLCWYHGHWRRIFQVILVYTILHVDPWWGTEQKETQGDYKLHLAVLLLLVTISIVIWNP